jgi:signal peptidase
MTSVAPTRASMRTELRARRRGRGIGHYTAAGLGAGALALAVGLALLVVVVPAAAGGQALTVLTNSMSPAFPPGTLVVIRPTPVSEIEVGDVLTYQIASGDASVVSHRVVARSTTLEGETTFTTRGDNNDVDDLSAVMPEQVRGTVWYSIPMLGWVNTALTGETRALVLPLAAVALFGYAAWQVVSVVAARGRRAHTRSN